MATRRKADADPAARSLEEARALLADFGALDAELVALEEAHAAQLARLKAAHEEAAGALKARLRTIFLRLKPWWAVAGAEVASGRKSAEIAGCRIGERTTPPKLHVPHGETDLIQSLELLGFAWALRVKKELDKPALIKALARSGEDGPDGEDARVLAGLGLEVRQREEFFIERIVPAAQVETVAGEPAPIAGLNGGAA
ncbi:MAG: host-nuclease inhibitor Gam family protein [Thermaurantiacus tibetensis]